MHIQLVTPAVMHLFFILLFCCPIYRRYDGIWRREHGTKRTKQSKCRCEPSRKIKTHLRGNKKTKIAASANIAPFIKAFQPKVKLKREFALLTSRRPHHASRAAALLLFFLKSPVLPPSVDECLIPHVSATARRDEESTFPWRIKHAAVHHTICEGVTFLDRENKVKG